MEPKTPKDTGNHIRTREEVEAMTADFEREQNRKEIARRLGGEASKDAEPEK